MYKKKLFCVLATSLFLIVSCSSSKNIQKKPVLKAHDLTLSKGVVKRATFAMPSDPTTNFTIKDSEAVALLNFEDISENINIRWEWYDPNGTLYDSTNNFPINVTEGKYLKEATAWHNLIIKGDDAANLLGEWEVKVYVNNELYQSQTFNLASKETYVTTSSDTLQNHFANDWGLIIGIENYAHLPNVSFAKKDALIMKEYFIKILGVPEENIITIVDSDATKGRLNGYLKNYIPSNVTSETTLYVYFAGHGAPSLKSGDPYLVPYDGDTLFIEETGYKLRDFYRDIEKLKIRQTYIFIDSCFSGSAARAAEMLTQNMRPALLNVNEVELVDDKIISLSSSSQGQTSNSYPEKEHGLFTYYLLKALDGEADSNNDHWLSIREVYKYVSQQVNRTSRRIGSEQNPSILPPLEMIKDSTIGRIKE
jgi:uncharacterized protein YcfL